MEVHVLNAGQQIGPFTEEALRAMVRAGSLNSDALVWHDGAADWYPVADWARTSHPSSAADGPSITDADVASEMDAAPSAVARPTPSEIRERTLARQREEAEAGPSGTVLVLRALGAGFLASLLVGLIWFGGSMLIHFRLPFFGLVLGWATGYATSKGGQGEGSAVPVVGALIFTFGWHLLMFAQFGFIVWSIGPLIYAHWLAYKWASD